MSKSVDWDFIKRALKIKREYRDMTKLGYKLHETNWEIKRGGLSDKVIVDVKISCTGKDVWTKIGDV